MKQAELPEEAIEAYVKSRQEQLDENVTKKRHVLREELLREELHDAHNQRIIEEVDHLLVEAGLTDDGTQLPNDTTNTFLKSGGSNSAYCIMYIHSMLKRRLKRGIDEWETYDFEQAENLLPELLKRLKTKIEGLE